ncbi:MAG: hypothetical protein JST92_18555 [Deltaproteobacteria bacterium]|nr:hypothetical protein [Deltaproteobacteria bacterium]
MRDRIADPALVARARRAIARLGTANVEQSYWKTFWLPRGAQPSHAVEELVRALWDETAPREAVGAEWWIGRSYTTRVPVGFHFDEDVKAARSFKHPRLSSVFFFNHVRGGQLAITDQTPSARGRPMPEQPTRLETVVPQRNRYATFAGNLFHGVLDAQGRTPTRPLPGPRGRLRVTLVVNYWERRPTDVPTWSESRALRELS